MTGMTADPPFFNQLYDLLVARKTSSPETSYVARLHRQGIDKILQKVGEEAVETILAAKNGEVQSMIHETADLWFHTLVMLAHLNLHPDRIVDELIRRHRAAGRDEGEGIA